MTKQKSKRKPPANHDDLPEMTLADFKRAKPAREIMPKVVAAYEKRVGRPPQGERSKVPLSLRIDPVVLDAYKATGDGWQKRMGEALAAGAKKLHR